MVVPRPAQTTQNCHGRSLCFSNGMRLITGNDNERDVKNEKNVYDIMKFQEENYQKREEIVSEFRHVKIKGNLIKKSF